MQKKLALIGTILVIAAFVVGSEYDQLRSMLTRELMLKGINLPSGVFAGHKLPGEYGRDYFYPDRKDVNFYRSIGMNVFRIGILWERIQPELNKALDIEELRRLDGAVRSALSEGSIVILDLHNFGRYQGHVIGSPELPAATLSDFWRRLASVYRDTDGVMFGLMNEPHDIGPSVWGEAVQAVIRDIRQTGTTNPILVAPTQWASARHFTEAGVVWNGITDPINNFAFEVHQYVDADGSGTHGDCPDVTMGRTAMQLVTDWLVKNKHKAFLGEFGASQKSECLDAVSQMLTVVSAHPEAWWGWTYFAGGRGWGEADLLPIPTNSSQNKPQLDLLKSFLKDH